MKIAITTPTGHVGSAACDFLLESGDVDVKLLGRRANTLTRFVQRGAEMAIGAQDDADYLIQATRDVDALFWVTPPGYGSDNVRAFQNRLARTAAEAIRVNRIARVVNLSSMGALENSGVGLINGLHDVERILNEAAVNITHLRPGFFFENLLMQLDLIRKSERIALPLSGTLRFPMIAARDVGRAAGERLKSRSWTGRQLRELHGAADLTFDEVSRILSEILGRKIDYVRCDPQQSRQALLHNGVSENFADLALEMYEAAEVGRLRPLFPRTPATTTPTTLAEFARDVMAPLMAESSTH